ncbi:trypsin-like serine peptidase [Sciscionella marina]|uniref:trypsin-like serine peptidase n=1 Tax=Sciscionella marina TaxID=508770 RepID=UPI00035F1ECB|nr:hypothetical protein [Sciscionella marina]
MQRTRAVSARISLTLTAAACTAGLAAPVFAGTADSVAAKTLAGDSAAQQKVLDYWTPERIAALTQPPSDNPPKSGPDGAPWTGHDEIPATVGRLFYTDHGEDASCTATIVHSANRSTVVTAGHCVNNTDLIGENNQWNANLMFVPGYRDGKAPYGKFVARFGFADKTWLRNDQQHQRFDAYDQGFLALGGNERGQSVQDATGAAQDIGFDKPGTAPVAQFGYPRAASDPDREGLPEFRGDRLAYCHGDPREYPGTADRPEPKGLWGTDCVMGGGSSGGPRIAELDPKTGRGVVVGDNEKAGFFDEAGKVCPTGKTEHCRRYLLGPQFGTAITEPLFERAQHAS